MAFQPASMYLYNNHNRADLHWSTGCSRALALVGGGNGAGDTRSTGDQQQLQLDQQRLASALLLDQQQQAIQAAAKSIFRPARSDANHQRRPDQQAAAAAAAELVYQALKAGRREPPEARESDDELAPEDSDDDEHDHQEAGRDDDEPERLAGEFGLQPEAVEAEQETALNLSLHGGYRNDDFGNLDQQFQDYKHNRHNNHNQNQHLKHLGAEIRSSFSTSAANQNSAQRLGGGGGSSSSSTSSNNSTVNELTKLQFNSRQSSQASIHNHHHNNTNHHHSSATSDPSSSSSNNINGSTSAHLNSFNSTGSSASSTSSSASSSSSSSSSCSSGWSSTAESLASCSPERATSISSPISTTTSSLIGAHQRNLNLLPQAHRQQQQIGDHRPLFLHHHHHQHHHHELGPVQKTDSDDLDRIRSFIEQFKARRGSLGLTQKQAAQCFRAYTNDRYAFSDNFVGHFEGFQFRPQTAMTIADSLAEWLEFAENETRNGHQLSFMPGKVKETRKRKYEVIRIRDSAKRVLVEAFEKNKSPSTSELEQLSRKTNIPSRNIEIFFKNRRTSRQYHQ